MTKKVITVILTTLLVTALTACGSDTPSHTPDTLDSSQPLSTSAPQATSTAEQQEDVSDPFALSIEPLSSSSAKMVITGIDSAEAYAKAYDWQGDTPPLPDDTSLSWIIDFEGYFVSVFYDMKNEFFGVSLNIAGGSGLSELQAARQGDSLEIEVQMPEGKVDMTTIEQYQMTFITQGRGIWSQAFFLSDMVAAASPNEPEASQPQPSTDSKSNIKYLGKSIGSTQDIIEISDLPQHIQDFIPTWYENSIILYMTFSFYNTESGNIREVYLFAKEGEQDHGSLDLGENEVVWTYSVTLATKDDFNTVDAFYASRLETDDYFGSHSYIVPFEHFIAPTVHFVSMGSYSIGPGYIDVTEGLYKYQGSYSEAEFQKKLDEADAFKSFLEDSGYRTGIRMGLAL